MDKKTFRLHFNYEVMAKLFLDISAERYPTADKIKQIVSRLVDPIVSDKLDELYIKIAILNAIRAMVKEVSPGKLYRSIQHRDDVFNGVIEALDELEEELQELEEQLEEDEDED
jgi:type III secretion protein W